MMIIMIAIVVLVLLLLICCFIIISIIITSINTSLNDSNCCPGPEECVSIQESLPFVAVDPLTPMDFLKIARFLNMVGLLAENLGCQTTKDPR